MTTSAIAATTAATTAATVAAAPRGSAAGTGSDRDRPQAASPPDQAAIDPSPRSAAIVAGIAYVVLFALGIFSNFIVREGLIVAGDAAETAANLARSETLFRFGLYGFLVIFVLDVVVAWALHVVFRSAGRDLSLLAAWSRLVYTVLLGMAAAFLFQALQLLGGAEFLSVVERPVLEAQALVALDTFNSAWLVGLVGFGLHLGVLGVLIVRSRVAPRALGWVLIAAGTAYVIDTSAHTLLADYAEYQALFTAMVAVPAVIAEGWFGLWLLFRGGRGPAPLGRPASGGPADPASAPAIPAG